MVKIENLLNLLTILMVLVSLLSVSKYVSVLFSTLLIMTVVFFLLNLKYQFLKPNRKILTLFSFLVSGVIVLRTNSNTLVLSLTHILIIFLCVKLLEDKKYRDYMQILVLSIFLTTASGLFNLSMIYLVFILLNIVFGYFLAIFATFYDFQENIILNKSEIKELIFKGLKSIILTIPLATLIFIILPRTNYPLFSSLGYNVGSRSGFSSEIGLGDVNTIQEDNRIAFRVVMDKLDKPLYFRGVVFDVFDGRKWKSAISKKRDFVIEINGKVVRYEIYLEPHYENFLITLDYPYKVRLKKKKFYFTNKLEVRVYKPVNKKIKYEGVSVVSNRLKDVVDIPFYTDVSKVSTRIVNFAKKFKKESDMATAKGILNYLKTNYEYSLKDLPTGKDSLSKFLFEVKRGNCEFFASSMALMLRVNKIPARLVGGFKGGYYNENGGYYAVANKNAHVWVEAFIDGYWVRFDPTPAAIENFTDKNRLPFALKMRLYFDYISYYWTKFVINYDFDKQVSIFKNVSSSFKNIKVNKKYLIKLVFILFIVFVLVYLAVKFRRRYRAEYYLSNFLKFLAKEGVVIKENEPLKNIVKKMDDESLKIAAEEFVDEFYKMRFKDNHVDYRKLKMLMRNIKMHKKKT